MLRSCIRHTGFILNLIPFGYLPVASRPKIERFRARALHLKNQPFLFRVWSGANGLPAFTQPKPKLGLLTGLKKCRSKHA